MSAPFTDPNVAKAIFKLAETLGQFLAPLSSIDKSLATIAKGFVVPQPSDVTIDITPTPKENESGSQ